MARKYLDEIDHEYTENWVDSETDHRAEQWREEREIYGFDARSTWSLNTTMTELIYERLMMYRELAPQVIVMDTHSVEFDGIKYTQEEALDEMIDCARKVLEEDDDAYEEGKRLWGIWALIQPAMWW